MRQNNSSTGSFALSEYRYPGEIFSLVITFLIIALLIALAILLFPGDLLSILSVLAITLAGVMVYVLIVLIQQRSALGTLVRVSPRQFSDVYNIGITVAERLSMQPVPVYVERSANMAIYPLGLWHRPLIVVTSSMLDQLDSDSLLFLIAREHSHIQAGHTWLRVLLKPLGANVAIIGKLFNLVIFGDWVNRSELTADRAGFLVCNSLTISIRAMLKLGVGVNLFDRLDIEEFLGQIADVSSMSGRLSQIVAGQPYLTQRIRALTKFALSGQVQDEVKGVHAHTQILKNLPDSFVNIENGRTGQENRTWLLQSLSGNSHYRLDKPHIHIGRHEDNEIVIADDRVSRFHAEIRKEGLNWLVDDMASSNGVWLNGKRIRKPEKLAEGDRLSFGRSEYLLVCESLA